MSPRRQRTDHKRNSRFRWLWDLIGAKKCRTFHICGKKRLCRPHAQLARLAGTTTSRSMSRSGFPRRGVSLERLTYSAENNAMPHMPLSVTTICRRLRKECAPVEPWEAQPPLDELIATILSQNTTDRNSDAAFAELRRRFPTWEAVRTAPVTRIVRAIRRGGLARQKAPR